MRLTSVLVVVCLLSAGCSPEWKAKFIRKKKNAAPPQAILVLEPDSKAVLPAPARYQEHYAYWKSWHSSLLDTYNQMRKRDRANLQGIIGEVGAMRALLTGEPVERLRRILAELREIQDQWNRMPDTWQPPAVTRTRLEQLFREVNKKFYYSKIKKSIIPEPQQEEPVAELSPARR